MLTCIANQAPMYYLRIRLITHTFFWSGMIYLSGSALVGLVPLRVIVERSLLVFLIQATLAYANMFWLVPGWFLKGRYLLYVVLLLVISVPLAALRFWLEPALFSETEFVRFVPSSTYPIVLFSSTAAVLLLSTGYALAEHYFRAQAAKAELEQKNLEAETNFLRSQINPHFLFNTLNNLYSLALLSSPKTPEAILKLSQLMRFMLYDAGQSQIALEKEVQYIHDFIDLELLRFEHPPHVQFKTEIRIRNRPIAPMLFIPCVENAFKFSGLGVQPQAFISFRMEEEADGSLAFESTNSISTGARPPNRPGGIGLDNLRKRLEILYPGRFTMKLESTPTTFQIRILLPPHS